MGLYSRALEDFRRAQELKPDNKAAADGIARVSGKSDSQTEAIIGSSG
jgi:cytochrome c-type biogenesis protein CcmH/NrfG